MAAYPEAKVIFLRRPFAKWHASVSATVQRTIRLRSSRALAERLLRPWLPSQGSRIVRLGNLIADGGVGLGDYGEAESRAFYDDYYRRCEEAVRGQEGRVLRFEVGDGWGPLCGHLGIRPPGRELGGGAGFEEAPFPRVNDAEAFDRWVDGILRDNQRQMWRDLVLQALAVVGFAWLVAYLLGVAGLRA